MTRPQAVRATATLTLGIVFAFIAGWIAMARPGDSTVLAGLYVFAWSLMCIGIGVSARYEATRS